MILPYVMEAKEHMNLSTTCTSNLFDFINGFRKLTTWSIKILDAAGKVPAGVMSGNVYMGGEYDQCASTTVMKSNGELNFQGQYCTLELIPPLPVLKKKPTIWDKVEGFIESTRNSSDIIKYFAASSNYFYMGNARIGICVPSGCSEQDVSQMINYISEKFYTKTIVQSCFKEGDIQYWTPFRTFSVVIMSLLAVLVLIATALDQITKNENNLGVIMKILQCFSITRTFPSLTSLNTSEEHLSFFNAMRPLSSFWVILIHEYLIYGEKLTGTHLLGYTEVAGSFFMQIVFAGIFSVDTFFFISGFLNSYLRTRMHIKGKKQSSVVHLMLHRLWRIYPALIFVHFIYYIFNNPSPHTYGLTNPQVDNCANNWWWNFVFINNFFYPENICMPHTWYVCADMQLFFLSLFVVPVLLKNSRKGYALSIFLILAGNVSVMIWHYIKKLPPAVEASHYYRSELFEMLQEFINPISHLGPYFIGIIIGHAISFDKDVKISKKVQVIGWISSTFLGMLVIFLPKRWNSGSHYTDLERILYGSFSKSVFALSLAWITVCCKTGYGGIVNYFLSLKIWFPLAKMNFTLYLISLVVQIYYSGNIKFPVDFNTINIVWFYLGTIFVSLLLCVVFVLMIEYPFIMLEKMLFSRQGKDIVDKPSSKEVSNMNKKNNDFQNGLQQNEYIVARL